MGLTSVSLYFIWCYTATRWIFLLTFVQNDPEPQDLPYGACLIIKFMRNCMIGAQDYIRVCENLRIAFTPMAMVENNVRKSCTVSIFDLALILNLKFTSRLTS